MTLMISRIIPIVTVKKTDSGSKSDSPNFTQLVNLKDKLKSKPSNPKFNDLSSKSMDKYIKRETGS